MIKRIIIVILAISALQVDVFAADLPRGTKRTAEKADLETQAVTAEDGSESSSSAKKSKIMPSLEMLTVIQSNVFRAFMTSNGVTSASEALNKYILLLENMTTTELAQAEEMSFIQDLNSSFNTTFLALAAKHGTDRCIEAYNKISDQVSAVSLKKNNIEAQLVVEEELIAQIYRLFGSTDNRAALRAFLEEASREYARLIKLRNEADKEFETMKCLCKAYCDLLVLLNNMTTKRART
jgi:hypothetical protein